MKSNTKIKVALVYPPYNNENYAFFSLAYLMGGLRKSFEKKIKELSLNFSMPQQLA